VTGREALFTLSGGVVGAAVLYGSIRLSDARSDVPPRADVVAIGTAEDGRQDSEGDASVDPAMVANANLVESLRECSQRMARLTDEESRVEQQLEAERMAEADASRSAQARRFARRDPSQSDWKQMASAGTVRYLLPCASFNPTPEVLDRLGLAPRDVPTIQSAFAAARATAWTQIRPLCTAAAGSTAIADRLGLDSCPQIILDTERATNPAAADGAMRAVGALKAGLADPSTVPSGDAVAAAFLVMTGVARDAESRLASVLGPEDAHVAVFGSGSCGRTAEFSGVAGVSAR
jgi:hypothetical protein